MCVHMCAHTLTGAHTVTHTHTRAARGAGPEPDIRVAVRFPSGADSWLQLLFMFSVCPAASREHQGWRGGGPPEGGCHPQVCPRLAMLLTSLCFPPHASVVSEQKLQSGTVQSTADLTATVSLLPEGGTVNRGSPVSGNSPSPQVPAAQGARTVT